MRYLIKMKSVIIRFVLFLVIFQSCGCGLDISGSFSGKVDGKKITIHFRDGKSAVLEGYFPVPLVGTWVEEKTLKNHRFGSLLTDLRRSHFGCVMN